MRRTPLIGEESGAVCLWAFRRYLQIFGIAEYAAERSVCEKRATYRGLEVSGVDVDARGAWKHREDGEGMVAPVTVRCRKRGNEWIID